MEINKQQFWTGVSILLNNYHAIDRKLFACTIDKVENFHELKSNTNELKNGGREEIDKSFFMSQLLQMQKVDDLPKNFGTFVIHFICIPKKGEKCNAKAFIDFLNCYFRILFDNEEMTDFELSLNGKLNINILKKSKKHDIDSSLRWRDYLLKPKFYKWCLNENSDSKIDFSEKSSLRLIDIEKYSSLYNTLKQKYSECAMKFWSEAEESTDPLKYIYEDLAIAAYLITLWQSDLVKEPPKTFADLGCGNGLLVFILMEEGYQGYGYDVRSRKLWSLYPDKVKSHLCDQAVEPFKFNLPAETDWLIGNHSDELSPWLPVIAATVHANINYFLLPCCPFEFSGNKFQRRNSSVSAYKDFCDYVEKVSNVCGFRTLKDRLKIPSTKRNAIIGLNCLGGENDFLAKFQKIKEFVKVEQQRHPSSSLEDIKLRGKTEAVKNCTQIEKSIIDSIAKEIFFLLLDKDSGSNEARENQVGWKIGNRLTMSQIAKSINADKLKQIKSECGGLKTLLRNKHEIFQFEKPDFVLIRKPQPQNFNMKKPQTIKKRICFFKLHHPQGCPLLDDECTFIH